MIRSATTLSVLLHAATIGVFCLAVGTHRGAPGPRAVRMEVLTAAAPLPLVDRARPEPEFAEAESGPVAIVPLVALQPFAAPEPRAEPWTDPRRATGFDRGLVRIVAPAVPALVQPPATRPPEAQRPETQPPAPVVVAARPLEGANAPPYYPRLAQRRGVEGKVVVALELDASGVVIAARVAESSGSTVLDAAALNALRSWRFEPATRDGRPIAASWHQVVEFRIEP